MRSLLLILIGVLGCISAHCADTTPQVVDLYNDNPDHLWNRLHRVLFIRLGPDGTVYGSDRTDPLYWGTTRHLLEEPSHREALNILDEFQRRHGERMVREPLKRALLQHDLWALFDWAAEPGRTNFGRQRYELLTRLAPIIQRLALTPQEIASLPDNYGRSASAGIPATLPRNLFQHEGSWINIRINTGTAPAHVMSFGGRSTFHVLVRMPEGRDATLAYLQRLNSFERAWIRVEPESRLDYAIRMNPDVPQFSPGTEWALVRRMRVIDTEGEIRPSPFIESIQLRRFLELREQYESEDVPVSMQMFQFQASRAENGAFREAIGGERDFFQFQSHDTDPFEISVAELGKWSRDIDPFRGRMQGDILRGCFRCHGAVGIYSVQSFARIADPQRLLSPRLEPFETQEVMTESIYWTSYQYGLLKGMWRR